ncbi:MAG: tetratricopeptide repeat protein [bacterium]|nr:tetratricopeptide repeat protein [bacterium]
MKRIWIVFVALCLVGSVDWVEAKDKVSPEDRAKVEAMYQEGQGLLEAKTYDQAIEKFQAILAIDEKHGPSYVGIGHAYLEQGDLKEAEKAFKTGLRKQKKYAPAYNGLGLVYAQKKNELRRAIDYFRNANRADKTYSEAQYNLGKTLERFGHSETLKAYEGVLKIDPEHFDAYYRIGRIHEADRRYEEAGQAFQSQVKTNPKHHVARLHLGMCLVATQKIVPAIRELARVAMTPSDVQRRGVLELAQVYQKIREYDRAASLFDAYISKLEENEQDVYNDLGLIAGGDILKAYRDAPKEARKELFDSFWRMRDPAPVTASNERLLEHYRRIAFALEHFGAYRFPWDARGEAYIRYGRPDHISKSSNIQIEMDPRVVAVKERLIQKSGEAGQRLMQTRQNEVLAQTRSMRREINRARRRDPATRAPTGGIGSGTILGMPVYPIGAVSVWEYWIYTDVGDGMELTFVQDFRPGPYEYAEMPLGRGRFAQIWQDMNPAIVMQEMAVRRPNTYEPDFATGPLNFWFASAAFKGEAGKTALEIYYGIPTSELAYFTVQGKGQAALLNRGVAVYDASGEPVYRLSEKMVLQAEGDVDTRSGRLIPEMDRILLPPGNYRVAIQVLDKRSGKSQVYNQTRVIPSFETEDKLQISDVELAAQIEVADAGKFLKGNISVVPMASKAYLPGQSVFIYYELYHLKRDGFGATKYRVSYEVKSKDNTSLGAKVLGGLGKLLGQRTEGEVITIEYEQVGQQVQEQGYLQLDMSSSEAGTQVLTVTVTDENSGQTAQASTTFRIQ